MAARTPSGWIELASYPDAWPSPAIFTDGADRFAFSTGSSVHVGEVLAVDEGSPVIDLRSFESPDPRAKSNLWSLSWSPSGAALALIGWEQGPMVEVVGDLGGCPKATVTSSQLLVVDRESLEIESRPNPAEFDRFGCGVGVPVLSWEETEESGVREIDLVEWLGWRQVYWLDPTVPVGCNLRHGEADSWTRRGQRCR